MISPKDLLEEARNLLPDPATEARLRTVISRAYYSAFHRCSEASQGLGFSYVRGARVHGEVTSFLKSRAEVHLRECGEILGRLRDLRNKADYELRLTTSRRLAEDALDDAAEVFATIGGAKS